MNSLFKFLYATLVNTWILVITETQSAQQCSSWSFTRDIGFILRGHVVAEYQLLDILECQQKCVGVANCLSINVIKNADGSILCQLNKVRKEDADTQFVNLGAGEYFHLKEKSTCTSSGQKCSSETRWHAFNQSLFLFVDTPTTWHDARKFCLNENGDLASIASEEEFRFVYSLLLQYGPGHDAYIGLNDIDVENEFVWSDGSPVGYTNFEASQPNNYSNEDCVRIVVRWSGQYGDIDCNRKRRFICEAE